ncbi:MAG TPA: hypothetical protein VE821_04710, partial [Pyrinomonadaceae bacterium]|nr:hypothetical protein [Pyrinomonadaceae bacterium]
MNGHPAFTTQVISSLRRAAGFARCLITCALIGTMATGCATAPVKRSVTSSTLAAQDEAFLEDLSRRAFRYFWEQADARTGLVLDRSKTDGSPS